MIAPKPQRHGVFALGRAGRPPSQIPDLAAGLQPAFLVAALGLAAIATGWLIATGHEKVVAALVVIVAVVVLAARAPGPLAALLLLAALNGIPIINLNGRLPGGAYFDDVAAAALALLLYAYGDRTRTPRQARVIRAATIWSACFVAYWLLTLARSVLSDGIPLLKAAVYGRDFLYFAILLPLALRARFPSGSLRAGAWVLLPGVAIYAFGATVISLTGVTIGWLVHPGIVDTTSFSSVGATRVYASMSHLVNTCLIFTVAFLLSPSARGRRWPVGAFALLLSVTVLLQLGRANYFGLGVALIAGTSVYALRYGSLANTVLRATVGLVLILTFVIAFAGNIKTGTGNTPVVSAVLARVTTGVSNLSQSNGTVGYRETLDRQLLHTLGQNWPIGLAFLNPSVHYVVGAPGGIIRNTDTGVFNILMTMGLLGVVLIYAPLAYGTRELLRAARSTQKQLRDSPPWLIYGGVAWIAWAVASSPTLVLLFSIPGIVVAALVLGLLGQITTGRSDMSLRSA